MKIFENSNILSQTISCTCEIAEIKGGEGSPIYYVDKRLLFHCQQCGHTFAQHKENCMRGGYGPTHPDQNTYYSHFCPECGTLVDFKKI